MLMRTEMIANIQNGIILERIRVERRIGVTLSCWSVPFSFSCTMLIAGNMLQYMVSIMTSKAGSIKYL